MKFLKRIREDHISNPPDQTLSQAKNESRLPPSVGIMTEPKGMDVNAPHNTWNLSGSRNGGARNG